MKIVTLSPEQFDRFAASHRYRNYYQSSAYGNVMVKFGYNVHYLGIVSDLNKLIGATLIIYKEIFMSNKIAYAPRGILFNYEDADQVVEMTKKLKQLLGKQGFMLLRMDPYIPETIKDQDGNTINFNNQASKIIDNLRKAGFSYKGKTKFFETEKPRWEALVLLNRDDREIFARFDKRTRNKIRKATAHGIQVYRDSDRDLNALYRFVKKKTPNPLAFYKELCKNFKTNVEVFYAVLSTETFTINSRRILEQEQQKNDQLNALIQDMTLDRKERNNFLNQKMESDKLLNTYKNNIVLATDLLKQYPQGIKVAGAMVITYDNAAYVFVDGVNEEYSSLNANYLLKWYMIQNYNNRGFKYLNLNAIVGEFQEKNQYSGLNEMKLGFNTTVTEYLGEFDIILNNFSYNLYKSFNKKK
ncbi:MAG: peptidoglycan bridge formation glycyltransferase FemA/FemB family protein [Mycoplasmatota bacterium]|nr:peptidoglycan bridge formation glycyltransferase FemA/FemB family protein [Mycoplasmatota bacterium]